MKKILTFLLSFLLSVCLFGCSSDNQNTLSSTSTLSSEQKTETISLVTGIEMFTDENLKNNLKSIFDNYEIDNSRLFVDYYDVFGEKFDIKSLIALDGSDIKLNDLSKIKVIFISADWCGYCQTEVREYLSPIMTMYNDIDIIQYFTSGGSDSVEAFYHVIHQEPLTNLKIAVQSENVEEWLTSYGIDNVPSFLFLDENNIVQHAITGTLKIEEFGAIIQMMKLKIDWNKVATVNGVGLKNYYKKLIRAGRYISSLNEIAVPIDFEE